MATGIDFTLRQRGRASVDFLGYLAFGGDRVRERAKQLVYSRFADGDALPDGM